MSAMNSSGIGTSLHASVAAPLTPPGKQAVGLEDTEAKQQASPPIEQSSAAGFTGLQQGTEPEEQTRQQAEADKALKQQQQDQQQIRELAARDREVRAHEQAHASVGGQYAGAPSFTFERGPDGVNYAVGGEVAISLPAAGDDPQLALVAAEQVRRAALAPADPSPQDRSIAASATQLITELRGDIVSQQADEQQREQALKEEQKVEEQQREEQLQQNQQQGQEREKQVAELQQRAFKGVQLGEQLVALDKAQSDLNAGLVLDQLV